MKVLDPRCFCPEVFKKNICSGPNFLFNLFFLTQRVYVEVIATGDERKEPPQGFWS